MKALLVLALLCLSVSFCSHLVPLPSEKEIQIDGLLKRKANSVFERKEFMEEEESLKVNWKVSINPNTWGEPIIIIDNKDNVIISDSLSVRAMSFSYEGIMNWNVSYTQQIPKNDADCSADGIILGSDNILYYLSGVQF